MARWRKAKLGDYATKKPVSTSEEELEEQRIKQENQQINENYEAYAAMDAEAETKKL